jgi:hypothetical protein
VEFGYREPLVMVLNLVLSLCSSKVEKILKMVCASASRGLSIRELPEEVFKVPVDRKLWLLQGKFRAGGELLLNLFCASAGRELKIGAKLGQIVVEEEAVGRKL